MSTDYLLLSISKLKIELNVLSSQYIAKNPNDNTGPVGPSFVIMIGQNRLMVVME